MDPKQLFRLQVTLLLVLFGVMHGLIIGLLNPFSNISMEVYISLILFSGSQLNLVGFRIRTKSNGVQKLYPDTTWKGEWLELCLVLSLKQTLDEKVTHLTLDAFLH